LFFDFQRKSMRRRLGRHWAEIFDALPRGKISLCRNLAAGC